MSAIQRGLKRLELGWRRMWIGLITRMLRARSAESSPDWSQGTPRVLFLRHDRIGDMIVTTGVLRAIARAHPNLALDVLASPANAPIIARDPDVHAVVVFDKKKPLRYLATMRALRRTHYDAVVDCMVTAPSLTTLLLMLASGARHRIGIAGRGLETVLTIPVEPYTGNGHIVRHLARLIAPFDVDPERADITPRIVLDDGERADAEATWIEIGRGLRLLVNISAGAANRRWPAERFVEVIRGVRRRWPSVDVIVMASPNERAIGESIAASSEATFVATRGIRAALALVESADVVLTPDTSIAHATDAFRTPVVEIMAVEKVRLWKPFVTRVRTVEWNGATYDDLPSEPVRAALEAEIEECARNPLAPLPNDGGGA